MSLQPQRDSIDRGGIWRNIGDQKFVQKSARGAIIVVVSRRWITFAVGNELTCWASTRSNNERRPIAQPRDRTFCHKDYVRLRTKAVKRQQCKECPLRVGHCGIAPGGSGRLDR